MWCIVAREIRNYLKNPLFWASLIFVAFMLYQLLNPYLGIHYFQAGEELQELDVERMGDADIMDGYVPSTEEQRLEFAWMKFGRELVEVLGLTEDEAAWLKEEASRLGLSTDQVMDYVWEHYEKAFENATAEHPMYGLPFLYKVYEIHQGSVEEANAYIRERLKKHSFSWYFSRAYADFGGLFLGFVSAVLLAFLFIRDTGRDTWELLHTKPISDTCYIFGKALGGFGVMVLLWGFLTLMFGGLCQLYGSRHGFPVNFGDFLVTGSVYVLPNLLMVVSIYTAVAILFKNPLPATPFLFLYMIYSNMGGQNAQGDYGFYGRPLAIMVRFSGRFFETEAPMAAANQSFLLLASVILLMLAVIGWKRRRVY